MSNRSAVGAADRLANRDYAPGMPHRPLALVTGANRGLGREVCRQLLARGYFVVLTARDEASGRAAAGALGAEFLPLDVADPDSVAALAAALRDRHPDGLDVLVCNAGVAMDGFDEHVARTTVDINFFGVARTVDALLPQLRDGGRVVFVSSGVGDRNRLSAALRAALDAPDLSRERLAGLMNQFVADVRAGRHTAAGWPTSAYAVSKIGATALTHVLARDLAGDPRQLRINAVCPGWARTDMGGPQAERSAETGAASIVWAATLPADGPTGGLFRDGEPAAW